MKTIEEKRALSKWFGESMNWYALFVQTKKEQEVVERLQKRLNPAKYVAFVPTRDFAYRKKDVLTVRRVPWLAGYVFIVSAVTPQECVDDVKPIIQLDHYMYKLLSNGMQSEDIALSVRDKMIMTTLLDEDFNIPAFETVKEGDRVRVRDEVLKGVGGKVLKVNKHKQTITFEMLFLGRMVQCEVMMRYISSM